MRKDTEINMGLDCGFGFGCRLDHREFFLGGGEWWLSFFKKMVLFQ